VPYTDDVKFTHMGFWYMKCIDFTKWKQDCVKSFATHICNCIKNWF